MFRQCEQCWFFCWPFHARQRGFHQWLTRVEGSCRWSQAYREIVLDANSQNLGQKWENKSEASKEHRLLKYHCFSCTSVQRDKGSDCFPSHNDYRKMYSNRGNTGTSGLVRFFLTVAGQQIQVSAKKGNWFSQIFWDLQNVTYEWEMQ